MFIIQQNNNIVYGPANFNYAMFNHIITEELELESNLPTILPVNEVHIVDANTSVIPAELTYISYNSKIEQLSGPFWDISETKAIGHFEIANKSVDSIKNELKQIVTANRYLVETADFTTTIQGTEVIVEGSRENKTIFLISYSALPDTGTFTWKFPKSNNFVMCSKADILSIIQLFVAQTQSAFDFESEKFNEIDACITIEELDSVILEKI